MLNENNEANEDSLTPSIIKKFELMISDGKTCYFDSEDLERIIDHYFLVENYNLINEAFELGLQLFPFSTSLKIKKAQLYIATDKPQKALDLLMEIEALAQGNEDFLFTLAISYSKLSKPSLAIPILEALFDEEELNDEVFSALYTEYQNIEDHKKSLQLLKKTVLIDPANELYLYSLIIHCELTNQLDEGISFLNHLIKKNPYSSIVWHYLGVINQQRDDHLKAVECLEYAVLTDEKSIRSYLLMAESQSSLGHHNKAIETCEATFEICDPTAAIYFEIGEYHEKADNLEKALSNFHKSILKQEDFSESWYSIAMILNFQNKSLESSYFIKRAVELSPENLDYLFCFAEIHEKIGFIKEAEIAYRKILKLDDKDTESWLNYSYILYNQEDKFAAIDTLTKGIKINPNCAELRYRLSAYFFQLGDEIKALMTFEDALKLDYESHNRLFKFLPSVKDNQNIQTILKEHKK